MIFSRHNLNFNFNPSSKYDNHINLSYLFPSKFRKQIYSNITLSYIRCCIVKKIPGMRNYKIFSKILNSPSEIPQPYYPLYIIGLSLILRI